jgi:hypothetical protein
MAISASWPWWTAEVSTPPVTFPGREAEEHLNELELIAILRIQDPTNNTHIYIYIFVKHM